VSAPRAKGESGETLAEILVTIAIVGVAVVALVGALAVGVSASSGHRQRASADTVARSVAEAVKDRDVPFDPNGTYQTNANTIWGNSSGSAVDTTGFNVTVTAQCLKTASASSATLSSNDFGSCPVPTTGVQLITVTATSTQGKAEQESVTILKRPT
jgi:Tfp pilus assembly protein PilV